MVTAGERRTAAAGVYDNYTQFKLVLSSSYLSKGQERERRERELLLPGRLDLGRRHRYPRVKNPRTIGRAPAAMAKRMRMLVEPIGWPNGKSLVRENL